MEHSKLTANSAGGPAFPSHGSMGEVANEGMTLRDYFAAKAMAVFMAEMDGATDDNPGAPRFESIEVADLAYQQADAMLKARSV